MAPEVSLQPEEVGGTSWGIPTRNLTHSQKIVLFRLPKMVDLEMSRSSNTAIQREDTSPESHSETGTEPCETLELLTRMQM